MSQMPVTAHREYVVPANCIALTRLFYPETERSDAVLRDQLLVAEQQVQYSVLRPLQSHQREALLCLVSDLVAGLANSPSISFERSFLVTALNRGMFQIAAAEFHVFCYAEGKVQTRLWEKRKAEQYLFSRGHLLF
jgi:lysozyme